MVSSSEMGLSNSSTGVCLLLTLRENIDPLDSASNERTFALLDAIIEFRINIWRRAVLNCTVFGLLLNPPRARTHEKKLNVILREFVGQQKSARIIISHK